MEDEKVKGREKVGESVTINWEINKKKKKCVCVCVCVGYRCGWYDC